MSKDHGNRGSRRKVRRLLILPKDTPSALPDTAPEDRRADALLAGLAQFSKGLRQYLQQQRPTTPPAGSEVQRDYTAESSAMQRQMERVAAAEQHSRAFGRRNIVEAASALSLKFDPEAWIAEGRRRIETMVQTGISPGIRYEGDSYRAFPTPRDDTTTARLTAPGLGILPGASEQGRSDDPASRRRILPTIKLGIQ